MLWRLRMTNPSPTPFSVHISIQDLSWALLNVPDLHLLMNRAPKNKDAINGLVSKSYFTFFTSSRFILALLLFASPRTHSNHYRVSIAEYPCPFHRGV